MGSRSLPPATPDEQHRFAKMKHRGCILTHVAGEIHHLLVGGRRVGHRYTVCLNPWLHRGVAFGEYTPAECLRVFGPSLARGSKEFHKRFGDDQSLLDAQDQLIGWGRAIIPKHAVRKAYRTPSKIVPRAA